MTIEIYSAEGERLLSLNKDEKTQVTPVLSCETTVNNDVEFVVKWSFENDN